MKERIEERIRQGGVQLAFDTNALWHHSRLFSVCNLANELRSKPPHLNFQLVVPAVAHGEHVLHIRHQTQEKGRVFDGAKMREDLRRKGLDVQTFGAPDAEGVAELIALRHPDDSSWQEAKRELALRRLGLASLTEARAKKVSATVDWLIAGQAKNNNWILVTDDQGVEFEDLERIDLESLETLLSRLLANAAEAAG